MMLNMMFSLTILFSQFSALSFPQLAQCNGEIHSLLLALSAPLSPEFPRSLSSYQDKVDQICLQSTNSTNPTAEW